MPTEAGRHRLYEKIKEQWGQDNADELMSYLPPVGWADVATKQDLNLVRSEIATLRAELLGELSERLVPIERKISDLDAKIAGLDGKIAGLDGKIAGLDGKIVGLEGKTDAGIADLRAEMARGFTQQTRWTVGSMLALTAIFTAVVNWLG